MGQDKRAVAYESDGRPQMSSIIGRELQSDHTSPIKARRNLSKELGDAETYNNQKTILPS